MHPPRAFTAMAHAIATRPLPTLVLLALLLAPVLVASTRVRPNNSLEAWFVEGDPALREYHEFLREFGSDEAVLVGFETPEGARSEAGLALQARIARRIGAIDGVARVVMGGAIPATLAPGLVAGDARAVAIVAWMAASPALEAERGRIIAEVRQAADAELEPVGRDARHAGNGVLYEGLNQQTMRDTGVFLGLALVAMVVLLAVGLRSPRAVALALVGPIAAAGAGVGLMQLAGRPFTVVSSALPTLILVIALADSIHVLLHYEQVRRGAPPASERERRRQVADAIAWVAVPCFFTSITTAAGFLALVTSRTALVRDFGIFAAAGMMLAWGVTLAFLTAALAIVDVAPPARGEGGGWLQRALQRYATAMPRLRTRVIAGTVVMSVVLAIGAWKLEVDTLTLGLLPERHEVRRDSEWIERNLGAYTPLEMVVTNVDRLPPGEFGDRLWTWRERAESLPDVQWTFSAIDAGAEADPADWRRYVSEDARRVRVTAYVPMMTARGFARAADALEREGARAFGERGWVQASGYLPLYVRITDYIVQSTVAGLASSFVFVFALMALLIRSRRGLIAAAPVNLLPVLLVFGVMGWLGIPLDIATATVGTIILGIVVDDTIHFLHRYQHERAAGYPSATAATTSLTGAGPSIVLTTAVLVAGFAVMIAAGTKSISYFGLIATLAIAGAMFADLLLLPVLLSYQRGATGRPPTTPGAEAVAAGGVSYPAPHAAAHVEQVDDR